MDKPQHLYHASPIKNIKEFEPRNEVPRYDGEANLVFATPKEALAAMFLAPRDFSIEIAMYDSKYVIFIEADEEAYDQKDTGGAIYELPTESFETDAQHGMGAVEWNHNCRETANRNNFNEPSHNRSHKTQIRMETFRIETFDQPTTIDQQHRPTAKYGNIDEFHHLDKM